ncbi:MAG: ComF family protein [Eubacterium sp.]|nr:ComF family protein [Eubacterium sp.]
MSSIVKLSYALLPKRCKLCGAVIEPDKALCEDCESLKRIEGKICNKCGCESDICSCKKERFSPDYKAFCAAYYYEGSVIKGVVRFKNDGFTFLKEGIASEISEAVGLRFDTEDFDFVTFVPMTKGKERKRGYNQSRLLAREVAALLEIPCISTLIKIRKTDSQRFSKANRRKENLFGAFDVKEGVDIRDKKILIIDDVKTTGSTLSECAAMLKIAGAREVYAASFAVTKKK